MNIRINFSHIFLSTLTLLFVWAKLAGHIDWSWWWVFAPVWIPFLIVLFFTLLGLALVLGTQNTYRNQFNRRRW